MERQSSGLGQSAERRGERDDDSAHARLSVERFGGLELQLGAIEGVADSTASLLKLWSGGWSDRLGHRKAFVVFGYVVAGIARPLSGLAQAPWHLFATRTSDRIGKGIRTTPRDALIADSSPPDQLGWAFGFARAMDHLAPPLGPLLAMIFLEFWPHRLPAAIFADRNSRRGRRGAFDLGGCAISLARFPSTPRNFRSACRPSAGNFRLYLLAMFVFTLGNSSESVSVGPCEDAGPVELDAPHLVVGLAPGEEQRQHRRRLVRQSSPDRNR